MAVTWSSLVTVVTHVSDVTSQFLLAVPGVEIYWNNLKDKDKLTLLGTFVGTGALYYLVKYATSKHYKLPPGPRGLPLIGNVHQLDQEKPHETITKWSEEYGDIFQMSAFGRRTVILNSYETIHEGLVTQGQEFAGRIPSLRMNALLYNGLDIETQDYSSQWAFRKKLSAQMLKSYGENAANLEEITMELINDMLEDMRAAKEPLDMYPLYHRCIAGIITSVIFGQKVEESTVQTILDNVDESMRLVQPTGFDVMIDLFPWLRFLPNNLFKNLLAVGENLYKPINVKIQERRRDFDPENPICWVDGMLQYQKKSEENGTEPSLSDREIFGVSLNMIIAATYSTSVTINALFAVLVNMPELQSKMAAQVKAELGQRPPQLSDRKVLPYIEAAIMETVRYSSIIALNSPHKTLVDTKIDGYDIPEGTEVLYNLWKLHHNPKHWDEPWEFKPERYLDKDGNLVPPSHENRKRVFAFGASRRVCIGEALAKNRLFLMTTSLLQHFEFLPVSPTEIPRHDPRDYKPSFGVEPYRYKVKLVPRK